MPGPRPVALPRHIQRPPDDDARDSRFAERPLLVHLPETDEWEVSKDDSVSIFLPVDVDQGLGPKGTLIDGKTNSNIMRLAQSFYFALCWSNPRRWCHMKCMVAVLHRDTDDGRMQNQSTQVGVLLYFQHEPQVFKKPAEEGAPENADEEAGEEVDERTLGQQLHLNYEEIMTYIHQNPEGQSGATPSYKRAKRSETTADLFTDRVNGAGVKFNSISTPEGFLRCITLLFPRVANKRMLPSNVRYDVCFSWQCMMNYLVNSPSTRHLPADTKSIQWLRNHFNTGDTVGTSVQLEGVDLYFPGRNFCTVGGLFSAHIPRSFTPPMTAEQVRDFYTIRHENCGALAPDPAWSDEEVFYSAFRDIYGHQRTLDEAAYPDYLRPETEPFFFKTLNLEASGDFVRENLLKYPFNAEKFEMQVRDDILSTLRSAKGPSAHSGMTTWLRALETNFVFLRRAKVAFSPENPQHVHYMQTFFQMITEKSPAQAMSAYYALEGVMATVSIASGSSNKKHMALTGPAECGKTVAMFVVGMFLTLSKVVPTKTILLEWGAMMTQFIGCFFPEVIPQLLNKGEGYNAGKSGTDDTEIRNAMLSCMENNALGRARVNTQDLHGSAECVSSGNIPPFMLLFINSNTAKFEKAFLSRAMVRSMARPSDSDWAKMQYEIEKNRAMDSDEFGMMIVVVRLAAWLPLLVETRHLPSPPQFLNSYRDKILSTMVDYGMINYGSGSARFAGALGTDALCSHAAVRSVLEVLREIEITDDDTRPETWKTTAANILTRASKKWRVTLQDLVFTISFENDKFCNDTLRRIVSLARLHFLENPEELLVIDTRRVNIHKDVCHLGDGKEDKLVEQINAAYRVDYLPEDIANQRKILMTHRRRTGGREPLVTRDGFSFKIDADLMSLSLCPVEQCILDFIIEGTIYVPDTGIRGVVRREPCALMAFSSAVGAGLSEVFLETTVAEVYARGGAENWPGIKTPFSLLRQIPRAMILDEKKGIIRVSVEGFLAIPTMTETLRRVREALGNMRVSVPLTNEDTHRKLVELNQDPPDNRWRYSPDDYGEIRIIDYVNGGGALSELPDAEFYIEDLLDYIAACGVTTTDRHVKNAFLSMLKLNRLQGHLDLIEGGVMNASGTLTSTGIQHMYEYYIGPLGRSLQNIRGLTEKPEVLMTMQRPNFETTTLRTIYYDPDAGEEVPVLGITSDGEYPIYDAAKERLLAESKIRSAS